MAPGFTRSLGGGSYLLNSPIYLNGVCEKFKPCSTFPFYIFFFLFVLCFWFLIGVLGGLFYCLGFFLVRFALVFFKRCQHPEIWAQKKPQPLTCTLRSNLTQWQRSENAGEAARFPQGHGWSRGKEENQGRGFTAPAAQPSCCFKRAIKVNYD